MSKMSCQGPIQSEILHDLCLLITDFLTRELPNLSARERAVAVPHIIILLRCVRRIVKGLQEGENEPELLNTNHG